MYRLSVSPCALARGKLTGIVLSLFVGAAQAADAPSLAALLQQSETQAPALLEQAATVRAAGADARQARAWANPSLGYTGENLGAPKMDGVSQRQDTYTLTQVFEIGGKRSARIEAEQRKAVKPSCAWHKRAPAYLPPKQRFSRPWLTLLMRWSDYLR